MISTRILFPLLRRSGTASRASAAASSASSRLRKCSTDAPAPADSPRSSPELRSPTARLEDPYPRSPTASPVSLFGSREKILVDEENFYLKNDITDRQDDMITYDAESHRCDEEEDEKRRFSDFLDVYGTAVAHEAVFRGKERQFVVSRDPDEWRHVENLLPVELIPPIPERESFPSGYVAAKANPGDPPYLVHRTNVSRLISSPETAFK